VNAGVKNSIGGDIMQKGFRRLGFFLGVVLVVMLLIGTPHTVWETVGKDYPNLNFWEVLIQTPEMIVTILFGSVLVFVIPYGLFWAVGWAVEWVFARFKS